MRDNYNYYSIMIHTFFTNCDNLPLIKNFDDPMKRLLKTGPDLKRVPLHTVVSAKKCILELFLLVIKFDQQRMLFPDVPVFNSGAKDDLL